MARGAGGRVPEAVALAATSPLFDAEWNNLTDPGLTGRARQ